METRPTNSTNLPPTTNAYNGKDRNAFLFCFNAEAELWKGSLAMIGFLGYFLWDMAGYSGLRGILHFLPTYVAR